MFDDCELDLERYELRRRGEPVHVEPQVFDVLVHLVRNRARLVTKNELLDAVWGDRFVSESALTSRLKAARRAVGDTGSEQRLIRTSFGRGYQFVGDVTELDTPAPTSRAVGSGPQSAADTALPTAIRFCTAPDGTRIAYAVTGEGPPLVKAANWMTHIDIDGANPVWRHWIEDLSAHHTLVRYDERGCGLSDWDIENFDFEDWIDDLRLVVNDAALDRFALLGVSQGAAVAIAFAARFPERVSHLVLLGSYGRGRLARATTDDQRREAALDLELARVGWSRDDPSFRRVFTSQFLPDGSPEQWEAFDELQRHTTSPENAVRFLSTFATIDITELAPRVKCPTLLLQSRGDLRQPLERARELAALIPGSQLVPLPSRNHLLLGDEPAWPMFLAELERFLAD